MRTSNAACNCQYWFSPKRRGWGWGGPCNWRGWVVMVAWVALLAGGMAWLIAQKRGPAALVFALVMCVVLIAIAWCKGDPAGRRWRW